MGNSCIDDNSKGKVSVIVPVYNVEKYLEECLSSIVNQTYKNIEIIIVNDGLTDNSYKIIESFKNKYDYIKVIAQKNKGLSAARNIALTKATGEFVMYIDSDDYIELNTIEECVNKIEYDNSEMVMFNYTKVYEDKKIDVSINLSDSKIYSGKEISELMLKNLVQGYVCFRMFKKYNLLKHKFLFEEGKKMEDFFPIFKETYLTKKVSFLNKHLYKYRQREGSIVNSNEISLMRDFTYAMSLTAEYAKNNNFDNILIENFKLIKSCIVIKNFYSINKFNKNMYSEFKKNKLDIILPSITGDIINKRNIKPIMLIITWRFKIYDKISKLKKYREG